MLSLLEVKELKVHFPIREGIFFSKITGTIRAVDGISFQIQAGKTLALVGESGCGKSTAARAILQLIPPSSGEVFFENIDLCKLAPQELRKQRRHFQMIFQDPFSSLNPRMRIGSALAEPFKVHQLAKKSELSERVTAILQKVGLSKDSIDRFPHEFSGGQRQRIAIARALATSPKLVICDEPVSSLDVSVRAQIVNLLQDLQESLQIAYLFISHELSIVRHLAHDVAVMYLGKIVEIAPKQELFSNPKHPYTQMLLNSMLEPLSSQQAHSIPKGIVGEIPSPENPPSGCAFHPRCPIAQDVCKKEIPKLESKKNAHAVSCFLA